MAQDFFFKKPTRKYIQVMILGIIAICGLCIISFSNFQMSTSQFWRLILSCVSTSLIIWTGSWYISHFWLDRINVFLYPTRLIIILSVSLIIYSSAIVLGEIEFVEHFFHLTVDRASKIADIIISCLITLFITTIHTAYFFFISWKENMLKAEKLEKDNLEAQYETLKNQVNPHFLFNSLNGLLSLVEGKPVADQYIKSLSEFLRYMMLNKEKEVVLLKDELYLVNQYLFIQGNRFVGKLNVECNIPEQFQQMAIAPLTLQMLVENCIKHNIISNEKPLLIKIYVDTRNYLVVENNLQKKEVVDSTKVGLVNIVNRYKYLTKKNIEITEERNIFKAAIPLLKVSL